MFENFYAENFYANGYAYEDLREMGMESLHAENDDFALPLKKAAYTVSKKKRAAYTVLVCMQHRLTQEQIDALVSIVGYTEIAYLENEEPELFEALKNSPGNRDELDFLVARMAIFIKKFPAKWIILPIGSPAFMFLLSRRLESIRKRYYLFAHMEVSEREEKTTDGQIKKSSTLQFVKWIQL